MYEREYLLKDDGFKYVKFLQFFHVQKYNIFMNISK